RAAAARERPRDGQARRPARAGDARANPRRRYGSGAAAARARPGVVVILCLVDDDPVSLEALTFARRFGDVEALVFGEVDVAGHASRARRVVHEWLDEYAPEGWAQAVVELEPEIVVGPGTDHGHEVLAHVAALVDAPLAANVIDAQPDGDVLQLTRQR